MKRKTAKEILAESFLELAEKKAVDKITVKDIIENGGYSAATFYRQFTDKYDLIAWAYSRDLEQILDQIAYDEKSWKQVLIDAANYYDERRDYLSNLLLNTSGHDSFVKNMRKINYSCLKKRILQSAGTDRLEQKTEMLI
ncbi:MAG: TetR family transcriptional regulator [Lachnospiraceae bacterium]|nr:TetR family transcriptional regulator [Lachnospiraceae bacterium]